MEYIDGFMKLVTHPFVLSLLPLIFSGWCTMILLQVVKSDRRMRMKRPLFPIEAWATLAGIGLVVGIFFQWGTAELITAATGWNTLGWKGWIVVGVGTPFVAWTWFEYLLHKFKDNPLKIAELKVKHAYGVHNTDMNGDGINDYIPTDETLLDRETLEKIRRQNDCGDITERRD
jgi:hypothetical protein